jgi:hypothetical protein
MAAWQHSAETGDALSFSASPYYGGALCVPHFWCGAFSFVFPPAPMGRRWETNIVPLFNIGSIWNIQRAAQVSRPPGQLFGVLSWK